MNKFYVLVPLVAMIVFGFFFANFNKTYTAEQEQKKADIAAKKAAQDEIDAKLAGQAAEEVTRIAEEKKAKSEADKKAAREKQEAEDRELLANIARTDGSIAQLQKELNDAELKLIEMRNTREKAESAVFNLAREVELTRIARRTAELELQRAAEMMADRTDGSALVEVPLFPAPTAAPKKTP
jgi:hypothetical protein